MRMNAMKMLLCTTLILSSLLPVAALARQLGAQNYACKDGTTVLAMSRKEGCADHGGAARQPKVEAPEANPASK
jgi:hypothetical protein